MDLTDLEALLLDGQGRRDRKAERAARKKKKRSSRRRHNEGGSRRAATHSTGEASLQAGSVGTTDTAAGTPAVVVAAGVEPLDLDGIRSHSSLASVRHSPLDARDRGGGLTPTSARLRLTSFRSPRPAPLPNEMKQRMHSAMMSKYNSTSPLVTHNHHSSRRMGLAERTQRHRDHLARSKAIREQNKLAQEVRAAMEASSDSDVGAVSPSMYSVASSFGKPSHSPIHTARKSARTSAPSPLSRRVHTFRESDLEIGRGNVLDTYRSSVTTMSGMSRLTTLPPVPSSLVSSASFHSGMKWRPAHVSKDRGFVKRAKWRGQRTQGATIHVRPSFSFKKSVNSSRSMFTSRAPRKTLDGFITQDPTRRRKSRLHAGSSMRAYSSFSSMRDLKHHKFGFGNSRRWE